MNALSVLLLLLLALWGVWAVRRILTGGCSSCGGDCASCHAACRQKQNKRKGSDPR